MRRRGIRYHFQNPKGYSGKYTKSQDEEEDGEESGNLCNFQNPKVDSCKYLKSAPRRRRRRCFDDDDNDNDDDERDMSINTQNPQEEKGRRRS